MIKIYEKIKKIILEAGEILKKSQNETFQINTKKVDYDLVTEYDFRIQKFLIEKFKIIMPEVEVFAEEANFDKKPNSKKYWVIDPIDGTVNFSKGIPEYCISVAYVEDDEPIMGFVYAPMLNLFYSAKKNEGAYLNDKKIVPNWSKNLKNSIITLGNKRGKTHEYIKQLEEDVMRIRLFGTAALQICYVASGYCDAFISLRSNPWDVAASHLILKEAGGIVINYKNEDMNIFSKKGLYTNENIRNELLNKTEEMIK
ncbi:inositol monophosphatase family protein [Oceanotoga sp. DSM 15011]|uniref:inositol monophosphatase family protein n=1 Tax=Oceanotoga TaxID=1255275 RepID=UPI0021F3CB07|nr:MULTISPECIES: inositol monophosphatase family protein [Oceanotoga]MDO7975455.1 inositol monophosphatase family protein [Oceanotoga teriensis]UYP00041.1 inositol monophosphatase family protein [Oceanotoga sp. DSM 15011]